MTLFGKISIEHGIRSPADKFYNLMTKQLNHVQNVTERVHHAKLHEGDDFHTSDAVKHWTYVIDGKVNTCKEKIESIDEANKTNTYILYDGDVSQHYKLFRLIFQEIVKNDGSVAVVWTIEYEKISDDIEPPYGYLDYVAKVTKDIDAHLLKA